MVQSKEHSLTFGNQSYTMLSEYSEKELLHKMLNVKINISSFLCCKSTVKQTPDYSSFKKETYLLAIESSSAKLKVKLWRGGGQISI